MALGLLGFIETSYGRGALCRLFSRGRITIAKCPVRVQLWRDSPPHWQAAGEPNQDAGIASGIPMQLFQSPFARNLDTQDFYQFAGFIEIEWREVILKLQNGRDARELASRQCPQHFRIGQNDQCGEPAARSRLIDQGADFVPDSRRTALRFIDHEEPAPSIDVFVLERCLHPGSCGPDAFRQRNAERMTD
jgi:hypothetical protein